MAPPDYCQDPSTPVPPAIFHVTFFTGLSEQPQTEDHTHQWDSEASLFCSSSISEQTPQDAFDQNMTKTRVRLDYVTILNRILKLNF